MARPHSKEDRTTVVGKPPFCPKCKTFSPGKVCPKCGDFSVPEISPEEAALLKFCKKCKWQENDKYYCVKCKDGETKKDEDGDDLGEPINFERFNPAEEPYICSLCGGKFVGWGNNPAPLEGEKCCDECNATKVIPARLQRHFHPKILCGACGKAVDKNDASAYYDLVGDSNLEIPRELSETRSDEFVCKECGDKLGIKVKQ